MADEEIKKTINGDRKRHGLPEGDIDLLLKEMREENFIKYLRKEPWKYLFTKILNSDGMTQELKTRVGTFRYLNKWNQESDVTKYRIILDEHMKVLWFGYHKERQYFISVDDNIYEIEYKHKFLRFIPTKCDKTEYFNDSEEEISDNIVKRYNADWVQRLMPGKINQKTLGTENVEATIKLDGYFEKGFFYKGPKWNRYWHDFLYPHDITMLIAISAQDGLFHIEIENITYPHRGYVLLDLRELRIVKTKKE
jgi:hypothetical protein